MKRDKFEYDFHSEKKKKEQRSVSFVTRVFATMLDNRSNG